MLEPAPEATTDDNLDEPVAGIPDTLPPASSFSFVQPSVLEPCEASPEWIDKSDAHEGEINGVAEGVIETQSTPEIEV